MQKYKNLLAIVVPGQSYFHIFYYMWRNIGKKTKLGTSCKESTSFFVLTSFKESLKTCFFLFSSENLQKNVWKKSIKICSPKKVFPKACSCAHHLKAGQNTQCVVYFRSFIGTSTKQVRIFDIWRSFFNKVKYIVIQNKNN